MRNLLTDFRQEFGERLIDLLWRQWTALGVSGHVKPWSGAVIDPDALLLFSCAVARHDARLFDTVLAWLRDNGRFISVQRIKRMVKEEVFSGESVLGAMAAVTTTSVQQAKWAKMAGTVEVERGDREPLFYLADGTPLPLVREPDQRFAEHGFLRDRYEGTDETLSFRPEPPCNLLLRLRALLGVNARCEILQFLLLNGRGSPRAMARDCYYFPATISKALAEMNRSGFLVSRTEGRRHFYRLVPETWKGLFFDDVPMPGWIVWARMFSALEQVWLFLLRPSLADESALAQASSLRRVLKLSVADQLERSCPEFMFGDLSAHPGEALIPFFIERVRSALNQTVPLKRK
jgi:hypothetical protein